MKKILSIFLTVLMTFGSVAVALGGQPLMTADAAVETYTENDFEYTIEDGYAEIYEFPTETETGELVIPETLGGYPVKTIYTWAYINSNFTSLHISANIENISYRISSQGSSLEKITVDPENKVYCSDENGVLFSKDMSELVAYPRNKEGATYKIPESVHSIALFAFDNNNNLTEITIPGNVKKIGEYSFYACSSLSSVVFENGVEEIGHFSFADTGISELSIPESVKRIGIGAFDGTPFTDNNSNYDEDGVLYLDNTVITSLKGASKTYEIKDGTRLIAGYAFYNFGTLDEIIIPASVQYVSPAPFNAKKITVSDDSPYLCIGERGVLYSKDKTNLIRYPSESGFVCFSVPEGVKVISELAVQSNTIYNTYIPDSVEYIGRAGITVNDGSEINYQGTEEQWDKIVFGIDEYNQRWFTSFSFIKINYNTYSDDEHTTLNYSKTEPSCTEIGETSWECSCGESGYIVAPPKGHHTYVNHGHDKEYRATCFKEGFYATTCLDCGKLYDTEIIPKLDHSSSHTVITSVKPTCTEIGYEVISCSRYNCYDKTTVYYDKLGHAPVPGVSYTKDGVTYNQCSRCDEFYLPEEEHIHTNEWVYTPGKSCTASGTETLTCTECGFISDTRIALPKGHDYKTYITEKTCTSVTTYYYCKSCGDNYYNTTITTGVHGKLETVIIEPGCGVFARGQKYEKCTICNARVSSITYIPSTGHSYTEEIIKEATESEEGIKLLTCSKCSYSKEETIPVIANTYDIEWIVDGEVEVITAAKEGLAITAPDAPVKEGYVFAGWTPEIPDEMPAMPLQFTAVFNKFSKSEDYDVSATYSSDCFDEEVSLDVTEITADREPGGVYMVEGEYYKQVGLYNIKAVNENSEVVQPNEGYTVTIRMAIPDAYKNRTDFMVYHRFTGGGREQLSTENGTLRVENGYLIFEVSQFSEFEIFIPSANVKITHLPDKTAYAYNEEIDLTGIRLRYTKVDGTTKTITDTSLMSVTGFDGTKVGKQTVTVSYGQYSDTFEVKVSYTWWQWIVKILFIGFIWY